MDEPNQAFNPAQKNDNLSVIETSDKASLLVRLVFKVVFATLTLLLLFYLANGIYTKQVEQRAPFTIQYPEVKKRVLGIADQKESQVFPVRLMIPSIHVDAHIEYTGVTSKGAMGVPNNTVDVGW